MENHLGFRENRLYCRVGGVVQLHIIGVPLGRIRLPVYSADIPKHSAVGFIAGLDPFHIDAFCLERRKDIPGVGTHCSSHTVQVHVLPVHRNKLPSGIREEIAVVEVNEYVKPLGLGPSGLCQKINLVAPWSVAVTFRIDPDSQPDGIHPDVLHQGEEFADVSAAVTELSSVRLHLCTPTYIGTLDERGGLLCRQLVVSIVRSIRIRTARGHESQYGQGRYCCKDMFHRKVICLQFSDFHFILKGFMASSTVGSAQIRKMFHGKFGSGFRASQTEIPGVRLSVFHDLSPHRVSAYGIWESG